MVTAAILDLAQAVAVGLAGPVGDHLPAGVLHLGARRLDRPQDGARRQDGERGFDRFTHDVVLPGASSSLTRMTGRCRTATVKARSGMGILRPFGSGFLHPNPTKTSPDR